MTDIRMRTATLDDLPQMVEVITSAYALERARLSGIPDVTEGLDLNIRDDIVELAERSDKILGVIVLVRSEQALMIANLAVSAQAQGKGVGRRLMQAAEEIALSAGCEHLTLRTHAGMSATRRFYKALGWVETGVAGQVVSMQKAL
ncbi:MAG: GNAT family N-acetyltransferase [Paracoccaceae bacterium]